MRPPNPGPLGYPDAALALRAEFAWNPWFLDTYWPENEPRIRRVARRALDHFPDPVGRAALEVGCANGYVAYLFARLGFGVTAVDAYDDPKREDLFRANGIAYRESNLNAPTPLAEFPAGEFELILLGEVFEHILNAPAGLLASLFRLLRPGGLLILTTPNPSTLANAVRVLRDGYVLWGTPEFLAHLKVDGGRIIDRGDIHYREYPAWVVRDLLARTGYHVGGVEYVRAGAARTQGLAKRVLKGVLRGTGLGRLRLFSPGYIIRATKPVEPEAGTDATV